jgi:hypothetical protein
MIYIVPERVKKTLKLLAFARLLRILHPRLYNSFIMKKQITGFLILLAIMIWIACDQNKNANPPAETAQQQAESRPPPQPAQEQPPAQEPQQQNAPATTPTGFRMPAFWENPDAAPMLAPTLDPATVSSEARAAYIVAQKKPKLLAQMPCFCYCDRFGHQSLHDCYVTTHAQGCEVCIAEAIEADQLDKQGMSPQEIRSVLVAKHHPPSE